MEEVLNKLINKDGPLTRADIAELLAAVAPSGEKRDEKVAAVIRLYDESGHQGTQFQGHHVSETLDGYLEY